MGMRGKQGSGGSRPHQIEACLAILYLGRAESVRMRVLMWFRIDQGRGTKGLTLEDIAIIEAGARSVAHSCSFLFIRWTRHNFPTFSCL